MSSSFKAFIQRRHVGTFNTYLATTNYTIFMNGQSPEFFFTIIQYWFMHHCILPINIIKQNRDQKRVRKIIFYFLLKKTCKRKSQTKPENSALSFDCFNLVL
jgi:hypothetical protein